MRNYYHDFRKISDLLVEVNKKLSDMLCIHDMYYVYCEEYHTKPPFIISNEWLIDKMPYTIGAVMNIANKTSEEEFDEYFKDSQMSLKVIDTERIINRLESLKKISDECNELAILKESFNIRKEKAYEFGKIEEEDMLLPNERVLLAMKAPDPIQKIIDLQIMLIQKIVFYAFHTNANLESNKHGDFYAIFDNDNQCEEFKRQIKIITDSMDKFIECMNNTDEE